MATHETSPAKNTYCVWADRVRRVYQEVEANSPRRAYEIAEERPECWQPCQEHDDNDYRLRSEVQDLATEEFIPVHGAKNCKTCGSEIVETVNGSNYGDGECGPCEYQRYRTQPELFALVQTFRQECSDQVQRYQDDLKEDFGAPDDLQVAAEHWKDLRNQCDAVLTKAHGQAA